VDITRLGGLDSAITVTAFSSDGARVAAGSADGTIRVWRVEGGVPVATLEGQTPAVVSLVFDHTGSRLLFSNSRSGAHLWDLADGRRLALGQVGIVQFSPVGQSICCGSGRQATIKSSVDVRLIRPLELRDSAPAIAAFSPDGSRIATGPFFPASDVKIHALTGTAQAMSLKGHGNTITSIDFSPDGRRLASGSYDQTIEGRPVRDKPRLTVDPAIDSPVDRFRSSD
jgi:WD40 repeat protein